MNLTSSPSLILFVVLLMGAVFAPTVWAGELQPYPGATYVETEYNDGDSFRVQFRDGKRNRNEVIRLYFVDCPETQAGSETDRRRLLEQSRYFACQDPRSVLKTGFAAREFVRELLQKPFTLHTASAQAPGRSKKARIYGMITLDDGRDLAKVLVEAGLARPRGITRKRPDGTVGAEYKEYLHDLEFVAALKRNGIWGLNNPEQLPKMRAEQRREDAQLAALDLGVFANISRENPLDLNAAEPEQLQQLSGIGTELAQRIIKDRPYRDVDDLLRVPGIGEVLLERARPFVKVVVPQIK